MSDLLSPFVVLFEDNADAFWCFEMLLRRMVCTETTIHALFQSLVLHCFSFSFGACDFI